MKNILKKCRLKRLEKGDVVSFKGKEGTVIAIHENYFVSIVSSYEVRFQDGEIDYCGRSELKFIK